MLRTELPHASRVVRPTSGQEVERGWHVGERDEMELQVLARRDVPEAARPALGHVGERAELARIEQALRDLHPQHLHAVLALPVGAAQQPEGAPLVGGDLAALVLAEDADELVDLRRVREGEASAAQRLGIVDGGHGQNSYRLRATGYGSG